MSVQVGFGELLDRIERHLGKWPTKSLVVAGWLAAMAFFFKVSFDYAIKPLIAVSQPLYVILTWLDAFKIALAALFLILTLSRLLDTYRARLARGDAEEITTRANDLLDDIRTFGLKSSKDRNELAAMVEKTMGDAQRSLKKAKEMQVASLLVMESAYEFAKSGKPISETDLRSLEDMIETARRECADDIDC